MDDADSDASQATLPRRQPLPPRADSQLSQRSQAHAPPPFNYSRPTAPPTAPPTERRSNDGYDRHPQSDVGARLGHRPRQRSQGYFEPSLSSARQPSDLTQAAQLQFAAQPREPREPTMPQLSSTMPPQMPLNASQIAAQAAMHNRKRSVTVPEPGQPGQPGQRQPTSPPPLPGAHSVTFRTNGMTYANGLVGGPRMAATTAANLVYPRSPMPSPGIPPQPEHGSPKPAQQFEPPRPVKEKSKMKLPFSKPKNIRIDNKDWDKKSQPVPSPGKMGIGIHSSQALNRMMMNPSTTSLADSTAASSASTLYSSANASTSTLVPTPQEKEKHKHHFLSRQKHKSYKDDHLPLSSASSTSRPTDPNAPQPLYSFAVPSSPGHASSFANSVTGLDLRHGGRHLRQKKKEEKAAAHLDATLDPPFRERNQSFSTERSEWPALNLGPLPAVTNLAPTPAGALTYSTDALSNLGHAFGVNGLSPGDAWPLLKARLLHVFEGEDPRPPVEDFNSLVTLWIKLCIQKMSPLIILDDLDEMLSTGFTSLDQTLRQVPDDRLIPHLVEMWLVVFTTILPFLQAVFLPLDLEFKGNGIMSNTAAAEFWGVLLPDELATKSPENKNIPILGELDLRRITLLKFRDIVILPRNDTLMAIFSRLSLENLNAGLDSPAPTTQMDSSGRPGTSASNHEQAAGSLNSTSQGSSGGYLESAVTSMASSTFNSNRSRATSNTSAGSFSAHSVHSTTSTSNTANNNANAPAPSSTLRTIDNSSLLQPAAATSTSVPAVLRAMPMDSAKVTETVGRMLQCVSVLVSLQSGDEAQDKMGRLNKELKYNWLGRGRTGRNRRGFVGPRRGGGINLVSLADLVEGVGIGVGA